MAHGLFVDLVLVYAIALGVMLAAWRARVPTVIALIGTGVIAGPAGLRIVSTPAEVEQLAEIGVVLLLFTVGLDFPLDKLRFIWRPAVLGGTLQVVGTAAAVVGIAYAAGFGPRAGLFLGGFVALSSTAIVLKELSRRNRLDSPAGRITTGILLFQDLCVVVLLLGGPILAGQVMAASIPGVVGRAILALVAVAAIARLVLPVLFRVVTASAEREAFPLAVLVASVGTAVASAALGVPMAIGAFLAGLVLGGSEFSHQAHAEVRPLRDLLTSLFFISLGMLMDVAALMQHLPLILAVAALAIAVKGLIGAAALAATGAPQRVVIISALCLAQVGEFSFVLGRDALEFGILSPETWQILLPASILTMLVAPALAGAAPSIAARLDRSPPRIIPGSEESQPLPAVIVLGFGIGGRLVASALREFGIPYRIIDLNGASVRAGLAAGEPIMYGDATAPDTLLAAGVTSARALVMVLSDPDAAMKVLRTAREMVPSLPVLVRTRYRAEALRLEAAGAIAVAEELEASLEVLGHLLIRLDIPIDRVDALIQTSRKEAAAPTFHAPVGRLG